MHSTTIHVASRPGPGRSGEVDGLPLRLLPKRGTRANLPPGAALLELHAHLHPGEGLYVCITSTPERTLPALRAAQASLSRLANVQCTSGKLELGTRLERNQQASWRPCPRKRATPRAGQGTGHCRRSSRAY